MLFTFHAGAGYEWRFSERFFLRPEFGLQWYDGDVVTTYSGLDYQFKLVLGYRFGKNR